VITFVPLALLSKLGDGFTLATMAGQEFEAGGGRIGFGDSVNRMWMHAVLILLALVVLRAARSDAGGMTSQEGGAARYVGGVRAIVLALATVWVASQWAPHYIADAARGLEPRVSVLMDLPPGEPVGQLIAGAEVRQDILVGPADDPPADAVDVTVCVQTQFVNFGRDAVGALDVTLSTQETTRTSRIDVAAIGDWDFHRSCLALPEAAPTLAGLRLVVRGAPAPLGSPIDRAVAVLRSTPQPMVPPAVFATPERDDRTVVLDAPLALRVTLEYQSPGAAGGVGARVDAAAALAVLWLPRLVALLALAVIALQFIRMPERAMPQAPPQP
jgi:hypothetical protein